MTEVKPVCWVHIEDGWKTSVEDESEALKCADCHPVYTKDALAAARDAALEEAAKACERSAERPSSLWEAGAWAQCCEVNAESIRALKEKQA